MREFVRAHGHSRPQLPTGDHRALNRGLRKAAKEDSNKQNKGESHADRATVSCRDLILIVKPGAQKPFVAGLLRQI